MPTEPPELLYHGTARRFIESIRFGGLNPGNRQYVHLSAGVATASEVGSRHRPPAILEVRARKMAKAGYEFLIVTNDLWLTKRVSVAFLGFPVG